MKMKNIEKKQVRKTKMYKHKLEENRDKEKDYHHYVRLFGGVNLAVICFMLLFTSIGVVGASVTYDPSTNTIFLENGTNTLASIYSEMSVPSVLAYNSETNTYTLSADISADFGTNADLVLEDATLIINDINGIDWVDTVGTNNGYSIKAPHYLTISNMIIKSQDSKLWKIWVYGRKSAYSASITDSDISGGYILIQNTEYFAPSTPVIVKNNYFHDTTMPNPAREYPLGLIHNAAGNAYVYNNTFENIHVTTGLYGGIIGTSGGHNGLEVDKLYIHNCSVNSYGMTFFYGSGVARITNFRINDCIGDALSAKEFGDVTYLNGVIENVTGKALNTYYAYSGVKKLWVSNVSIDGAGRGLYHLGKTTPDLYNVKINNSSIGIQLHGGLPPVYLTNSLISNCDTSYWFYGGGEVREYQLTDIYVVDTNGYPVETATVTIEAVNPDVSDCIINRKLEPITQTTTLSNGHTPLPNEDESKTVALLRLRKTSSTERSDYSYNITAEKDGVTATVTVDPDESWYREDPNTYPGVGKGIVIITLPITSETGTISGTATDTNGTAIENATVSDGTRSATTNETGGYIITTVPEGNYMVTASADGYESASKPANVTAGNTTTVNFESNPVGEILPPITNATITPTPNEAGWNNVIQVVVTFFRSDTGGAGVSYTNYSETSETGPWTTVNIATAMGPDAENVTDIGEDKFNVTVSDEGVTTIWYYTVNNNATSEPIKNVTVKIDTTPPASISDLQNTTGTTWINWTWTNPTDADFSHTMVYLNGIFKTNTSNSYYNATGLSPDTSYEIGTHTVDTYGNVNTTWVNQTTKTVNNLIPRYDVNEDGTVDILDTTIVGQHFGEIMR